MYYDIAISTNIKNITDLYMQINVQRNSILLLIQLVSELQKHKNSGICNIRGKILKCVDNWFFFKKVVDSNEVGLGESIFTSYDLRGNPLAQSVDCFTCMPEETK